MHDIGVILANKHKSGAAHICGQLIDFIKSAIDDVSTEVWIAKIADDKIISFAHRVFVILQINATNPESIRL